MESVRLKKSEIYIIDFMRHIIFLFIVTLVSCKKETVLEAAPSLIGTWKHYSSADDWHIIYVYDNGDGKLEWYVDNEIKKETVSRTWYLKDNTIYFGKVALNGENYEVIDYPAICQMQIIENFDTLKLNKRFMQLDEGFFVEID
jgi:hypothetical protein